MARQWLVPGLPFPAFVHEDGDEEWLLPGGAFINEDQAASGDTTVNATTDTLTINEQAATINSFTPDLNAFRFYQGDDTEAVSAPLDAQDTNITLSSFASDWDFQLRLRVDETGQRPGAATDDYQLQYKLNAGAWTNVTGASSVIQGTTAGLTNDAATTNRASNGISDPGAGSFVAGEQSTDGLVDNLQITAGDFTELAYGLRVIAADVDSPDTIDFQLSTPTGIVNSVVPRITINTFAPDFTAFRFYDDDGDSDLSTALAAQDVNITVDVSGGNDAVQLRVLVEEQASGSGMGSDDWQLQFSQDGGGYVNLTTGSTGVRAVAAGLTNESGTLNRASNGIIDPGTGSFVAGEESADGEVNNMQLTSGDFTEHVYGIEVVSADVSGGETFDFRLITPAGITNTAVPRIGVDYNISASTDTLTINEFAATIDLGVNVNANTETLTINEQAATVSLDITIQATTDTLTINEFAATIDTSGDTNIDATTDTLTINEQAATIVFDVDVLANTDTLTINEFAASVDLGVNVLANTDTLTSNEQAATIVFDVDVLANTDTLTINELQAAITSPSGDTTVNAGTDTLTLTERQATIVAVSNLWTTTTKASTTWTTTTKAPGGF